MSAMRRIYQFLRRGKAWLQPAATVAVLIGSWFLALGLAQGAGLDAGLQVLAAAPPYCPPLPRDPAKPSVQIKSGDVRRLRAAAADSPPGTQLLLEDGQYRLDPGEAVIVESPELTIRSLSGNRDAVVITGGDINVTVSANGLTIADLTLASPVYHNVQVHGEAGVSHTRIYNVHALDAGQQLIKVSAGEGAHGKFADDGLGACSLIEYTTFSRGTAKSAPSYTNGVDVLAGKGWIIRDNVFRRIRSAQGPAGPAVLVWRNAQDTVVIRNKLVDCWRGIVLGLRPPDGFSRGGVGVPYDHENGLVANNVFLALNEPADAAIENNFAHNSRILHNTVYYRQGLSHAVYWSIEYRFPPTPAVIRNNLTNQPVLKRPPFPTAPSLVEGNIETAKAAWFRDVMQEDLRLGAGAAAIDAGVSADGIGFDFEGVKRPLGKAPDVGAYEFAPNPSGAGR